MQSYSRKGRSLAALLPILSIVAAAAPLEARSPARGQDPTTICGYKAYVTNAYADSMTVIDTQAGTVIETLPTGDAPINPTFNRDWTKLYVANVEDATLTILDARTGRIERTIPAGQKRPSGLRFLPDGRHLVISFLGGTVKTPGYMGIMDLQTGALIKQFPLGAQSERFDITPDGKRAYVANLGAQSVEVIDLAEGRTIATIPITEALPFNVLMSRDGSRVYVAGAKGKAITEIDTRTNTVTRMIATGEGPNGMVFSPDGSKMYVTATYSNVLQTIDLASGMVVGSMPAGEKPGHLRLTPDGKRAIIVRPFGTTADLIDMDASKVIQTLQAAKGPSTVAICGNR
jgi:YVTN family beta-propeller protein